MFERYTKQAKDTIVSARREARQLGSPAIKPEHILLALLNDEAITGLLIKGCSVEEIRDELFTRPSKPGKEAVAGTLALNSDALKALYLAAEEADELGDEHIGNEHLLLGLLRTESRGAAHLLKLKGITVPGVRSEIASLRTRTPVPEKKKRSWRSLLGRIFVKSDKEAVLLRRISRLVGEGRSRKALELIDSFMAEPAEDKVDRIRKFAPHAAAIARAIGDVSLARKYYELVLGYNREDPLSLYGMADALDLQGEHEAAKECAIRCYRLAIAGKDPRSQGVVELVEKRFPNFSPFR